MPSLLGSMLASQGCDLSSLMKNSGQKGPVTNKAHT